MARAMAETGLPYIISFTIRRTGTLVDGTPIDAAIGCIDRETQTPPALYMTNCVHPAIAYEALAQPVNRTERITIGWIIRRTYRERRLKRWRMI